MNIVVCMKQTPDTEASIVVKNGKVDDSSVNKWIISPYDEFAIEEALRLKQKHGGNITVISMGPDRVADSLRSAYALGVDKAIHINDERAYASDSLATARILAETIKKEGEFDIILAGIIGQDLDNAQTGILIAELLRIPHIGIVTKLEVDGNRVRVECEIEGGKGIMESATPVLMTTQQGLNEPRYPSLKGIMAAKKKKIELLNLDDLGMDASLAGSKLEMLAHEEPPKRPEGTIIDGKDATEKALALLKALHDEAKVL